MEQGNATIDQYEAAQAVVVAKQLQGAEGKEGSGVHIMQFYQQHNGIMWVTHMAVPSRETDKS